MKKESKNFKSLFCESCTPSQVHKGCDNKGVLLTPRKYQAALYCTDDFPADFSSPDPCSVIHDCFHKGVVVV